MSEDVMDEVVAKVRKKPGRKPNVERQAQAVVQSAGMAPSAEQWGQLISALQTNKESDQRVAADLHAHAMKKALRPENEASPMVSVYNPKGERDFPRPKPNKIYMMGPYPIADPGDYATVTWTELELLNELKPGTYPVTKADGTTVRVSVKMDYDGDGSHAYRCWLIMPIANDEQKESWPPLVQVLTEINTGETPTQSYARYQRMLAEKDAELTRLRSQVA